MCVFSKCFVGQGAIAAGDQCGFCNYCHTDRQASSQSLIKVKGRGEERHFVCCSIELEADSR